MWFNQKKKLLFCPTFSQVFYFYSHFSPFFAVECVKCWLFYILEKLTNTDYAVQSPVFSPDFKKLIYLANNIGGPHAQCSRLMMVSLKQLSTAELC